MTAGGGLAGPSEQDVTELTTELSEELLVDERRGHLRIVYSADRPVSQVKNRQNPRRPASPAAAQNEAKEEVVLDRAIQGQIGSMLRDVFAGVANEPVPSRFVDLLDALAAQEKQR